MSATIVFNTIMGGLLTGLVYGLAAVGFSLVFTVNRVVNLAHGGMMVAGMAAVMAFAARRHGDALLMLPVIAAGLFVLGFCLQRLVIERVMTASEQTRLLLMTGVGLMALAGSMLLTGSNGTMGHASALPGVTTEHADILGMGPVLLDRVRVRTAVVAMIAIALLFLVFNLTQTGKEIRACADNPFGARVIGLNLPRLQAITFGLGVAISGVAGGLLSQLTELRPTLAPDFTILVIVIGLIGGLGSVGGALLGGLMVGVVEALASGLLTPAFKGLFGCGLVVLILIFRPHGLLEPSE